MTQRRITAIAAGSAAVVALTLTGCSSGGTPTPTDDTGAGVLTIVSIPNYQNSLPTIVEDFEKANKDIDVQLSFVDVAALNTQLRTQLSAGTAPDIFTTYPGNGTPTAMENLVPGGYLMDMSDLALDKRIPSGMDSVTKIDGKRYVLPVSLGAIGGIYNMTAMKAAGLTPPTTWSELLQFCKDATAKGKVAFAYGAQTGWQNQFPAFPLSATLVYGATPDWEDQHSAGKATFADSPWRDVFTKVAEAASSGCYQASPLGTSYEQATALVASGDALVIDSTTSTIAAVAAAAPSGTELKFYPIPGTDNADQTWISAGGSGGYSINAAAKNPVAAKKFMDFMASDAEIAKLAQLQNALPSITSPQYTVPDSLTEVVKYVNAGKIHPYDDQLWPNAKVATALIDNVQLLIDGKASVDDVLKAMDDAYAEGAGS